RAEPAAVPPSFRRLRGVRSTTLAAMRRSLGAALALLAALAPSAMPAATAAPPDPVRIMIIGDSVAQGSIGDWTWRYRLWQTLKSADESFDFVGPRSDVYDLETYEFGSHTYADPDF